MLDGIHCMLESSTAISQLQFLCGEHAWYQDLTGKDFTIPFFSKKKINTNKLKVKNVFNNLQRENIASLKMTFYMLQSWLLLSFKRTVNTFRESKVEQIFP